MDSDVVVVGLGDLSSMANAPLAGDGRESIAVYSPVAAWLA